MAFTFDATEEPPPKVLNHPPPLHGASPLRKKAREFSPIEPNNQFISNVSFRIPANDIHANKSRNKCASIFARMQQVDPTLVVLPSSNPDLPPLTTSSSFPTDAALHHPLLLHPF